MAFKKGQSGNPGGRPAVLPEVRTLMEMEKNSLKVLIVQTLALSKDAFKAKLQEDHKHSMTEEVLFKCIERMSNDGNIDAFRKLLEIIIGKLPEDKEEFSVSPDEKALLIDLRRRLEEQRIALSTIPKSN